MYSVHGVSIPIILLPTLKNIFEKSKKSVFQDESKMNWNNYKGVLGHIAIVAVGVLVANQVQKMLDKSKILKPKEA
jgi:hypothetical protein